MISKWDMDTIISFFIEHMEVRDCTMAKEGKKGPYAINKFFSFSMTMNKDSIYEYGHH